MSRPERARSLIESRRSLLLSSVSRDHIPLASYAPHVISNGHIYCFLSHLAEHTANLLECPLASVLFIEDESDSDEIFARSRVQYRCSVKTCDRQAPTTRLILDQLGSRHGDTVNMIRELPDFVLFELTGEQGTFVEGFARASQLPPLQNLFG